MGEFYDRMNSDLRLARRSEATRAQYLREARKFVAFFMKPPTELGEAHIREYLHFLVEDCKISSSSHKMVVAAIKFLYARTLQTPEVVAAIPWPKVEHKLPSILSFRELDMLFQAAPEGMLRTAFTVAYCAGLRNSEVRHLRIDDLDTDRKVIIVRKAKGRCERMTLLSHGLLSALREYWAFARPPGPWFFPGHTSSGVISRTTLQRGFRKAIKCAGIRKRVIVHSLRHSFAVHLFEAGTDSRVIQSLLGHKSPRTTNRYLKVRADFIARIPCPLELMKEHLTSK